MSYNVVIELGPGAAAAARAESARDRAETAATATAADRVQTGLDAAATAADRVQTGLDRTAAGNSAASAALSSAAAGVASGRLVITEFSELATKFVYASPAAGQQIVAAGDVITLAGTSLSWLVRLSTATGVLLDYTGASGIKLDPRRWKGAINPQHAGAAGDGVTNDRAAMQAAINWATANGLKVDGLGLTYSCPTTPISATCPLENAKILGRVQGSKLTDLHIVSDSAAYGVQVRGSSGSRLSAPKLRRVKVEFDPGTTVEFRLGADIAYTDRLLMQDCEIDYGASLIECADHQIIGNTFDGKWLNQSELLHCSTNSSGLITGNNFLNALTDWLDLYSAGRKTVVTGNNFNGCLFRQGHGIEIKCSYSDDPSNTSGAALGFAESIVIQGNTFTGMAYNTAVFSTVINVYFFDGRASPPSFGYDLAPNNIVIDGNVFDGFDGTNQGTAEMAGIRLFRVSNATIENNQFRNFARGASGAASSSILWVEDCKNVAITGNRGAVAGGNGLSLHGANDRLTIRGNHFDRDERAGIVSAVGILMQKFGSRADPVLSNSVVDANIVNGTSYAFRHVNATASSLTQCTFTGNQFLERCEFSCFADCSWIGNRFAATTSQAASVGNLARVSTGITWIGNTTRPASGVIGALFLHARGGSINDNRNHGGTDGIFLYGTNVAGSFDHLTIRDNLSIGQSSAQPLPRLLDVNAADTSGTGQIILDNNRKVAA